MGAGCGKQDAQKQQKSQKAGSVPAVVAVPKPSGTTLNEWLEMGGTKEEFDTLDKNGDGVLDKRETAVLDPATWDAATALKQVKSGDLKLKDPQPLYKFLALGDNRLPKYEMCMTKAQRCAARIFFTDKVGLSSGDAKRLDRGSCRMTVMRTRMGKPPTFGDAYDSDRYDSAEDEVDEERPPTPDERPSSYAEDTDFTEDGSTSSESPMSRSTWMSNGGKADDFNLVDTNGDGVVDKSEAQVLDPSLWDAPMARKMMANLNLKDPEPLFYFLKEGNKLENTYNLQTTAEEREEMRWQLERAGLAERDAKRLERQMCRWTVMRMRMGRPAAFKDAFEESDDDDDDDYY